MSPSGVPDFSVGTTFGQCCFCCRLVNGDGFHSTGRLPTERGLPRALRTRQRVATRLAQSTSLHRWLPFLAVLLPLAESPWAPPAATGGACLDLTPLPDFCNHTKGRAHRANVRSSRGAPFLGPRRPGAPKDPGNRERRVNTGTARRQSRRPKSPESACARRQQRPTLTPPSAPLSSDSRAREMELSSKGRPTKTHPRTNRTNGTGLWRDPRHFPLPGGQAGTPFLPDRHPRPTRGWCLEMSAPFSRTRIDHLDGWTSPPSAAAHARGTVLATGPIRGDPRRS